MSARPPSGLGYFGAVISVCVAVHERHGPPNVETLATGLMEALGGEDGELIVALNGMPADAAPGSARVVELPVNRGVAPGWNAAASLARGGILVFANDDMELGAGSLQRLVAALRPDNGIGVAGVSALPTRLPDEQEPRRIEQHGLRGWICDAVRGHLFAVRRETFDQVGGFDEQFAPCLWEEADFCLAVRRRTGLLSVAVDRVEVAHSPRISAIRSWPWVRLRHSGTTESLRAIRRRNRARFEAKWSAGRD